MTWNKKSGCCPTVKQHFKSIHRTCHRQKRKPCMFKGSFLNEYCSIADAFNDNEEYQVCYELTRRFHYNPPPKAPKPTPQPTPISDQSTFKPIEAMELPAPSNREERILMQNAKKIENEYQTQVLDLQNENNLLRSIIEELKSEIAEMKREEEPEDESPTKKLKKLSFFEKLDKISQEKEYKKSYSQIKERRKKERVDECAMHIMSCCIDRKAISTVGVEYMIGNTTFFNEVMNVVNSLKNTIKNRLKLKDFVFNDGIEACEEIENEETNNDDEQDKTKGDVEVAMAL